MEKAVPLPGEDGPSTSGAGDPCHAWEGDRPTIQQLVADHHTVVYRFAFRLTGTAADADDLTQQAFLLAHQKLAQLRDASRSAGWLLAIARNCFLKSRRRGPVPTEPLLEDPIGESSRELPDWIDPERLQAALARLPDDARTILVLYFFEDCSYREIAESLDVPIGTVMSRLSRAKARLRQELSETTSLPGVAANASPAARPDRQVNRFEEYRA